MTTVTVRVDEQTKKNATAVLADIGLDVSTAVRMFLRQVAIRGQMPIELVRDAVYNEASLPVSREPTAPAKRGEVAKATTTDELG